MKNPKSSWKIRNHHEKKEIIKIKRKERITVWPSWVKELLWHEQNKKCPLTNKPIPESEIFDGKKWEVEHDLALENGGTNDLDNLQLACPTENKKKGSKKNYKPLTTYAWTYMILQMP